MFVKPLLAGLLLAVTSATLADDDRPEHFQGKEASNLAEALSHLREYNRELETLLDGDLETVQTHNEIHQLTYTLENALERVDDEIDRIEERLEAVHLGSERADAETVSSEGRAYLENIAPLIEQ